MYKSLNHIYRLVWSQLTNGWVAVAETKKSRGKSNSRQRKLVATALALGATLATTTAIAAPSLSKIVKGQANIYATASLLQGHPLAVNFNINQLTENLTLDWNSFNVGAAESVTFNQPNAQAIAINNILGNSASSIFGRITATGQIFLINPNGIIFGLGSQVNVGGLVASALKLDDSSLHFSGQGKHGSIENQGAINAGSYVVLLGSSVSNQGSINARLGTIILGAGNDATLTLDNNVSLKLNNSTVQNLLSNGGLIQADGGTVVLTAGAKNELLASVVNNTGLIEARTVGTHNGAISLLADMGNGVVKVGGTLDASARDGGDGGAVTTNGYSVKIAPGTKVTTLASAGKSGSWLIDPTDFTISADPTVGDISGATLTSELATTSVVLSSEKGTKTTAGSGDINVNDVVSWGNTNASTLTLTADHSINVNAALNVGNSGGLILNYAQMSGSGLININAPINLANSASFSTQQGGSPPIAYTVINSLGTANDINTGVATLQGIAANSNLTASPTINYVLGSNIDASPTQAWNAGAGFTPIGLTNVFQGIFNGLGHTITGLTINLPTTDLVGLFSQLQGPLSSNIASISDVGLINANIKGSFYVGGLVGIDGHNISNSYVTGNVTGTGSWVGGLIGLTTSGAINNCYAITTTSGGNYTGGLVGYNYSSIVNSYAIGAVSGNDSVGGLVGFNHTSINTSYAAGTVTGVSHLGGLAGDTSGFLVNQSYWDTTTSGLSTSAGGGLGLTTQQMQNGSLTSALAGFTFGATAGAPGNSWVVFGADGSVNPVNGVTYPMLTSEYSTSISNAHQLQLMALAPTANYTQVANIDAGNTGVSGKDIWNPSYGFVPVGGGLTAFTGQYDGQNHTISGLTINNTLTSEIGLFGYINGGVVQNVNLVGVSINGAAEVGGLAGTNYGGTINNSTVTGSVSGSDSVGGLVGKSTSGTYAGDQANSNVSVTLSDAGGFIGSSSNDSIMNSQATGTVLPTSVATFSNFLGGFIGLGVSATINNSSATGNVQFGPNSSDIGGFAGLLEGGNITQSYATGTVGPIANISDVSNVNDTGGFAGYNAGSTIKTSFALGSVSGYNFAGGFVAYNSGSVMDSYATGAVSGNNHVGGFIGDNNGLVNNVFSTGAVAASGQLGGLVGVNSGIVTNGYWDTTTSGISANPGGGDIGTGLTDSQMKLQSSFVPGPGQGFNFGTPGNGTWFIFDGQTYPLLQWPMTALNVSTNNPAVTYNGSAYTLNAGNLVWTDYTIGNSVPLNPALINGQSALGYVCIKSGCAPNMAVNAGSYMIVPTGLYSSQFGYMILPSAANLGIAAADLSVTLNPITKVYDGTLNVNSTPTFTSSIPVLPVNALTGVQDTLTGAVLSFDSPNVLGAGNSTVTVSGLKVADSNNGGNYVLTVYPSAPSGPQGGGGSTITPANIEIGYLPPTKVYDGTTGLFNGRHPSPFIAINGTSFFTNVSTGPDFVYTDPLNYSSVDVAGPGLSTAAVTNLMISDGNNGKNYNIVAAPTVITGTITQAPLYVINTTVAPKVANGTDTTAVLTGGILSLSNAAYTPLYGTSTNPDSNYLTLTQAGNFTSSAPGTGITVIAADSISGTAAGNKAPDYNLIQPTGLSGTITQPTITLTLAGVTVKNIIYDGKTVATFSGGTLKGVLPGDTVGFSLTGNFVSPNASYTNPVFCNLVFTSGCTPVGVNVTATLTGAAGKYALAPVTGLTGDIMPDPVIVTGLAQNKVYDGTATATIKATATALVNSGQSLNASATGYFFNKKGPVSAIGTWYATMSDSITIVPNPGNPNTLLSNYWLLDPSFVTLNAASITGPMIRKSTVLNSQTTLATPANSSTGNELIRIETTLDSDRDKLIVPATTTPGLQIKGGGVKLLDDVMALN